MRISPTYEPNGLAVEVTTSSCGGDASIENDQLTLAASALPGVSVTPPAPPFTVTV